MCDHVTACGGAQNLGDADDAAMGGRSKESLRPITRELDPIAMHSPALGTILRRQ